MTNPPTPRDAPPPRTVEGRVSSMGESEPRPDPMTAFSTRIPESLRKRVRMAALDYDREVQSVVAEALEAWLARHERHRG